VRIYNALFTFKKRQKKIAVEKSTAKLSNYIELAKPNWKK